MEIKSLKNYILLKSKIIETEKLLNISLETSIDEISVIDIKNIFKIFNEKNITINLNFYDEKNFSVNLETENSKLDNFINEAHSFLIDIEVLKNIENNVINIYDDIAFFHYLNSLSVTDMICFFSKLFFKGKIYFKTINDSFYFKTESVFYGNYKYQKSPYRLNKKTDYDINYQLPFALNVYPNDFKILECENILEYENIIDEFKDIYNKFNIIQSLLSLIYLSDSVLLNDNKLEIVISGFKSEFDINIDLNKNEKLLKLYDIVYENNNFYEKLILFKNIITKDDVKNILYLDDEFFFKFNFEYNLLQRKNIEKYISLKSEVNQNIINITNLLLENIKNIRKGLSNNFLAFFTFLISVFFTNIITNDKNLSDINNIKLFSNIIIIGSIIYYIILIIESNDDEKTIVNSYYLLKSSYEKDISKKDLDDAFNNDYFFNEIMKNHKKIKKFIMFGWGLFLFVIFIIVNSNLFIKIFY